MPNQLTILNTPITQIDNLFSLNIVHQSEGGEAKHKPVLFLRLESTKALIAEIESDGQTQAIKVYRGSQGGTYVCEELVLSYAMWISPKFHLIVLRAFLAMHKAESQNANQIQPLADAPPKPTGASLSFSLLGKRLTHQSATNLYRYRYRSPLW